MLFLLKRHWVDLSLEQGFYQVFLRPLAEISILVVGLIVCCSPTSGHVPYSHMCYFEVGYCLDAYC